MKQRIVVIKEDIFLGRPENTSHCPIALALKGTLQREVAVGVDRIIIKTENWIVSGSCLTLFLSESLRKRIERFDNNKGMEPFEFYIELPADSAGFAWEEQLALPEALPEVEYAEAIC